MTPQKKVQCWIFSSNTKQCLLLKTNKARGEFWQPVTGTVDHDETLIEAASREAYEETGLCFESPPQNVDYIFDFESRFGPTREYTYLLTVVGTPLPTLDTKEHQAHQWTDAPSATKILKFASNIEGLKKAYRLVFGQDLSDNS